MRRAIVLPWSRSASLHLWSPRARVVPGARLGLRRQGGRVVDRDRGRRAGWNRRRGRRCRPSASGAGAAGDRLVHGRAPEPGRADAASAHLQPRIPERCPRSVRPDGRSQRRQWFSVGREGRQLRLQREDTAVRHEQRGLHVRRGVDVRRLRIPLRDRVRLRRCGRGLRPDLPDEDRPARVPRHAGRRRRDRAADAVHERPPDGGRRTARWRRSCAASCCRRASCS